MLNGVSLLLCERVIKKLFFLLFASYDFWDFFHHPTIFVFRVLPTCKSNSYMAKYEGQVLIPKISHLLMLTCITITLGFSTPANLVNAYGIAVVFVMALTSSFLVLIMIMIWKMHILLVISYILVIGTIELLYLSTVFYKFNQEAYLALTFALVLMGIIYTYMEWCLLKKILLWVSTPSFPWEAKGECDGYKYLSNPRPCCLLLGTCS